MSRSIFDNPIVSALTGRYLFPYRNPSTFEMILELRQIKRNLAEIRKEVKKI